MHGICSHKLMYSEAVEARSNYKNLTCGDLEISHVVIGLASHKK